MVGIDTLLLLRAKFIEFTKKKRYKTKLVNFIFYFQIIPTTRLQNTCDQPEEINYIKNEMMLKNFTYFHFHLYSQIHDRYP